MGTATALVVQNTEASGPGRWVRWLAEGGLAVHVVEAYSGAALPTRLEGYDALLVLGGPFMPDDDRGAPWLSGARDLVRQALRDQVPYFGICLGGQMLAQVAGGEVRAEHGPPETGSTSLELRQEAEDDVLFGSAPARFTAIERHVDAITALPPGARWLVRSEACPYQAFRVGDLAWGVQFHPEANADNIPRWNAERLARQGVDRDALHERALRDEPASAAVSHALALRFAAVATGVDVSGLLGAPGSQESRTPNSPAV